MHGSLAQEIEGRRWAKKRSYKQTSSVSILSYYNTSDKFNNRIYRLGIYGMVLHIMQQAGDVDQRVTKAHDFRTSHLSSATQGYPEIRQFLVPIQKLLVIEVEAVAERMLEEKTHGFDKILTCYSITERKIIHTKTNRFARKYLLPCRHIFHLDGEVKIFTSDRWQKYLSMFEESDLEVYETMRHVFDEEEGKQSVNIIRTRSVLQLRELEEGLRQQLYVVHEIMEENVIAVSEHQETVENLMSHVCKPSPLSRIFYLKKLPRNMAAMGIVISLNKCESFVFRKINALLGLLSVVSLCRSRCEA
jgi:hypothetical protein